jgi:hypothetical protein
MCRQITCLGYRFGGYNGSPPPGFIAKTLRSRCLRTVRSLRLILRRAWQRSFVKHLAKLTAIDPASAGRAADEMLAHSSPEDGAAGNA